MAKVGKKSEYDDLDFDELLAKLTPEEIEELANDIDPDDTLLPPSQRCRDQTKKSPTGPFNRKALLDFLENKAKQEKDWDETKPYSKETRGKVWKPKDPVKEVKDDDDVETEWDDVLAQATEEELVDLAAVLGFYSCMNQDQFYSSLRNEKLAGGGWGGVAKATELKLLPDEPPNDTDVEDVLNKLKDNDPKLKEVNLNNIKNISLERLEEICEALKKNTVLTNISMSNVRATDRVGKAMAAALEENSTLVSLNMESNFIGPESVLQIFKSINTNKKLTDLRIANQKPSIMGNKIEMQIMQEVEKNTVLINLGIFLDVPTARIRTTEHIQKNIDRLRKQRMGIPEEEAKTNGTKKEDEKKKEESAEEESDEEEEEEEEEE